MKHRFKERAFLIDGERNTPGGTGHSISVGVWEVTVEPTTEAPAFSLRGKFLFLLADPS